ncbi:MAG: NifU N-terminal domain-containing protein [Planctomycetes bacterium]|nr:NifU N-terminal domain-containing protein [Planctomycetota bacterium]
MTQRTVTDFQPTPNPNALKCVLSHPLPDEPGAKTPRSYFNSSDAQTDPLASKFFALSGIVSVLILPGWVTVVKAPNTTWTTLKPKITAILAQVPLESALPKG